MPFAAAILLSLVVVFGYWFALANRYRLLLYYHDMGPLGLGRGNWGCIFDPVVSYTD